MTPTLKLWGASLARLPGVDRAVVYGSAGRRPEESDVLTVALDAGCKMGFASSEQMGLVRSIQEKVRSSHGALTLCLLFTDATVLFSGDPPAWQREPDPALRAAVRIGVPFAQWWQPEFPPPASRDRPSARPHF